MKRYLIEFLTSIEGEPNGDHVVFRVSDVDLTDPANLKVAEDYCKGWLLANNIRKGKKEKFKLIERIEEEVENES